MFGLSSGTQREKGNDFLSHLGGQHLLRGHMEMYRDMFSGPHQCGVIQAAGRTKDAECPALHRKATPNKTSLTSTFENRTHHLKDFLMGK